MPERSLLRSRAQFGPQTRCFGQLDCESLTRLFSTFSHEPNIVIRARAIPLRNESANSDLNSIVLRQERYFILSTQSKSLDDAKAQNCSLLRLLTIAGKVSLKLVVIAPSLSWPIA